ncbi:MAG: hypothetical protein AAB035_05950 [Nitrospirota bacterium]
MSVKEVYLSPSQQVEKWREINEWLKKSFPKEVIPEEAFKAMEGQLKSVDSQSRLFYGFGDDGAGNADSFLTGHLFVTYLVQKHPSEKWRFIDFYPAPPDPMRFDFYRPKIKMREGAAVRPKGFYLKQILEKDYAEGIGATHQASSPGDVRKLSPWGWGSEGFQFLALEDAYVKLIMDKKVSAFVLGDYAVSPYGTNDFSSTMVIGHSRGKLELGMTNMRDNIPKFAPSHFA